MTLKHPARQPSAPLCTLRAFQPTPLNPGSPQPLPWLQPGDFNLLLLDQVRPAPTPTVNLLGLAGCLHSLVAPSTTANSAALSIAWHPMLHCLAPSALTPLMTPDLGVVRGAVLGA